MSLPLLHVTYRIQNAAFLSYAEYNSPSAAPAIQLLPFRDNKKQHWTFEKASNGDYFYIRNVGEKDIYLQCLNNNYYPTVTNALSSASLFRIIPNEDGTYWIWGPDNVNRKYLCAEAYCKYFYCESSQQKLSDNEKWHLVPVTVAPAISTTLKAGTYRIRNFQSKNLLTASTDDSCVFVTNMIRQDRESKSQEWAVTLQQNGRYTIQNLKTLDYMGYQSGPPEQHKLVVGTKTSSEWEIQSVDGFAWSLRVPGQDLSVGFADYEANDADEPSLQTSDTTSNQIWFFEKATPIRTDQVHAMREVPEGIYCFQSFNFPNVCMDIQPKSRTITLTTSTTPNCKLEYINSKSPRFTLSSSARSESKVSVYDNALAIGRKATEFVLLRSATDSAYYLCAPDLASKDPRLVVSSSPEDDIQGTTVFPLVALSRSDSFQLWKLVDAQQSSKD